MSGCNRAVPDDPGWSIAAFFPAVLFPAFASAADDHSKPTLNVVVERNELLAGQTIGVTVWVQNPTDSPVKDMRMRLTGPDFVAMGRTDPSQSGADRCMVPTPIGPLVLGDVAPLSVLDPPAALCLRAADSVAERDINLAFSLTYRLDKAPKPETGVIVVEKKLSVGLFGTESVAGVSLRLAAYVVPGLLLLLILRLAKVPGFSALQTAESATLSVLISVLLNLVPQGLTKIGPRFVLGAFDTGVSAWQFLIVCAAAVILGIIVAILRGIIVGVRAIVRRRRDRQRIVLPGDDPVTVLAKGLLSTGDPVPVTVLASNQSKYVGSVVAPTADGGGALVGWFELHPTDDVATALQTSLAQWKFLKALKLALKYGVNPTADKLRQRLQTLLAQRKFLEALKLAQKYGVNPTAVNLIREIDTAGQLTATVDTIRRFTRREFVQRIKEPVPTLGFQTDPIVLA